VPFQNKSSRPRLAHRCDAFLNSGYSVSLPLRAPLLATAIAATLSQFAIASNNALPPETAAQQAIQPIPVVAPPAIQPAPAAAQAQSTTTTVTTPTSTPPTTAITLPAPNAVAAPTIDSTSTAITPATLATPADHEKRRAATKPVMEVGAPPFVEEKLSPVLNAVNATTTAGAANTTTPTPSTTPESVSGNPLAPLANASVPAPSSDSNSSVAIEAPPTDLWDRIRAGYAMEDLDEDLVRKWEKYYAERPDYVARIVDRSSKYMFYIVTELERRNLPLEIALLPMIESAFNPIAHSTAKASGIWQFIPSTGTAFGMKQDWWADSRRDIVAATNGALDYLTKLHGMFGDWQLALASYNWGEGAVMRASAKAKRSGLDGTYLTLNMPAETRNYLPKLQAVKNIVRDPARFGLTLASIPNEPYFKTITLAHAIDLKKAANLAGMTEAEFVALNPAHNRPVIAGRGEFQILLPADRAEQFIARLEAYEHPRVSWMAYKTRAGDRIDALAQRFGTTIAALRSVNGIRSHATVLPAGYNLLVPSDGPSNDALGSIQNAVFTSFPEQASGGGGGRIHRVRKGESLGVIARRHGVATATLAKWNRLGKSNVRAGQVLYINGPAPLRASGKALRTQGKYVKTSKKGATAKKKVVAKKTQRRR
jgi:membrane-bound lytic murein transglycosylase D